VDLAPVQLGVGAGEENELEDAQAVGDLVVAEQLTDWTPFGPIVTISPGRSSRTKWPR